MSRSTPGRTPRPDTVVNFTFTGRRDCLAVRREKKWRKASSITVFMDLPVPWACRLTDLSSWSSSRIVVRMRQNILEMSICQHGDNERRSKAPRQENGRKAAILGDGVRPRRYVWGGSRPGSCLPDSGSATISFHVRRRYQAP